MRMTIRLIIMMILMTALLINSVVFISLASVSVTATQLRENDVTKNHSSARAPSSSQAKSLPNTDDAVPHHQEKDTTSHLLPSLTDHHQQQQQDHYQLTSSGSDNSLGPSVRVSYDLLLPTAAITPSSYSTDPPPPSVHVSNVQNIGADDGNTANVETTSEMGYAIIFTFSNIANEMSLTYDVNANGTWQGWEYVGWDQYEPFTVNPTTGFNRLTITLSSLQVTTLQVKMIVINSINVDCQPSVFSCNQKRFSATIRLNFYINFGNGWILYGSWSDTDTSAWMSPISSISYQGSELDIDELTITYLTLNAYERTSVFREGGNPML